MRKILAVLAAVVLASTPCQADYNGLVVTSGGSLKKLSSNGTVTGIGSSLVSFGHITYSANGSFYALNSAGTDLYKITLTAGPPHIMATHHVGSLGVTGYGLTSWTDINTGVEWLFTGVKNSGVTPVAYETWYIDKGTASAFFYGTPDDMQYDVPTAYTADSAYPWQFFYTNDVQQLDSNGNGTAGTRILRYDPAHGAAHVNGAGYDGVGGTYWMLDNNAHYLSYVSSFGANDGAYTDLAISATGLSTYNGMCWGYVPW